MLTKVANAFPTVFYKINIKAYVDSAHKIQMIECRKIKRNNKLRDPYGLTLVPIHSVVKAI